MNKRQEQFIKLVLFFLSAIYLNSEKDINKMLLKQRDSRDDILKQIGTILLSYKISDSVMNLTLGDKTKLNTQMGKVIDNHFIEELKAEKNAFKSTLQATTDDSYNTLDYCLSLGQKAQKKTLSKAIVKDIIGDSLEGAVWSDRLHKNKTALAKDLKHQINQFLNGKIGVNDIEKVIKAKYDLNASNTKRLVLTEVTRCQAQASEQWAQDWGIDKQIFVATLDSRTSKICRGFDGQVFDYDDPKKPIPPLHPYCRSCLSPMVSADWRPKERLDNSTKERIDWQTYQEWNDKN